MIVIGEFATYGIFKTVEELDNSLSCDGGETVLPKSVIGSYTISADDSLMPSSENLDDVREKIWEDIKAYRDNRLLVGGYPAGGHWYYSDLIARSQHQSNARKSDLIYAAGGDENATMTNKDNIPIYIKSMDNGYMPISAKLARDIVDQAEIHEMATYTAALTHKSALAIDPNPSAYDYMQGWPVIFGE